MSGINLKKRLITAGILIPIVWGAAILPGSWFIINIGKISFTVHNILGFPMMVILEFSHMM